jgi:transcriptional regulator with XRE-family HTH domain
MGNLSLRACAMLGTVCRMRKRKAPPERLRAWLQANALTQDAFVDLLKKQDPTLPISPSGLSRILKGSAEASEHFRLIVQQVTGIPEVDWLPEPVRRLAVEIRGAA